MRAIIRIPLAALLFVSADLAGAQTLTPSVAFSTHDEPVDGIGDSLNASFPWLIRTQSTRTDRAMHEFPLAAIQGRTIVSATVSGTVAVNNAFDNGVRTFEFSIYAGNGVADVADHQIPGFFAGVGSYHPPIDTSFTYSFDVTNALQTIANSGASHAGLQVVGTSNPNFPNVLDLATSKIVVTTSGGGPIWTDLGLGLSGSHGVPQLGGVGIATSFSPVALEMTNARPSATCFLITGPSAANVPLFGGTLVPFPQFAIATIVPQTGALSLVLTTPGAVPPGVPLHAQYWVQDPAAPLGYAASNGVTVTTQ